MPDINDLKRERDDLIRAEKEAFAIRDQRGFAEDQKLAMQQLVADRQTATDANTGAHDSLLSMGNVAGVLGDLQVRWGELHLDIYPSGECVVADRDAAVRANAPGRTYRGANLPAALAAALQGEGDTDG